MAVVALVVDERGSERVVITDERSLYLHHVGPGEVAYVVPDLVVTEPVPSEMFEELVARAQAHAYRQRFSSRSM